MYCIQKFHTLIKCDHLSKRKPICLHKGFLTIASLFKETVLVGLQLVFLELSSVQSS